MKNIIKISLAVIVMTSMTSCDFFKSKDKPVSDSAGVNEDNIDVSIDSSATEIPLSSDSTVLTDSTKTNP